MVATTAEVPRAAEPLLAVDAHQLTGARGLWHLVRTRRGTLAIASVCAAVAAVLGLVPYACVAWMAAAIHASPPDLAQVQSLALVAIGAVIARHALAAVATAVAHVAAFRILHDLRVRIAHKLGEVPLSLFASRGTGELKRTMMDDVNQIESFIAHHLPDGIAALTAPIAIAAALVAVDWRMALASVAVAPLAFAAMAIAMRGGDEAHRVWAQLQDRTNASLLEYVRGIHVIKTFGLTARSFGDLRRSIEDGIDWVQGFMRTNGRGYGAFGTLIGSSVLVLLPLGGWLHLRGSLALADLVLFLVLGPQLLGSSMRLLFAHGNLQRIAVGTQRIASLLAERPLADPPAGATRPTGGGDPAGSARGAGVHPRGIDASVRFQDVGFAYRPGVEVLDAVSFEARAGEVTALVGASGAGKTTIARLIPRLWEHTRGRIEIGGVATTELPLDALLARIAIVFQDVFLFHGTVRENLTIARPDADDAALIAACQAARIHDAIAALPGGYGALLGERGARLSGGERQRLSIARAILKDAPIVILDEATAFADPENEAAIQDAIASLCAGRTVIVIAHRLSTVAGADQLVVLERGRTVDAGRHDELLARCAIYQRLWRDHDAAIGWSLEGRAP